MKKLVTLLAVFAMIISASCDRTDFDEILRRQENQKVQLEDHEARIKTIEGAVKTVNADIAAIKGLVDALQGKVTIVSYKELADKTGYELLMSDNSKITLKNGAKGDTGAKGDKGDKGDTGAKGDTPLVNVKAHTDGLLYWTINGDWMLDAGGNKIPAQGKDGKDGANGKDGINGSDGKDGKDGQNGNDGKTPQMRVNTSNHWEMSLDAGVTWTEVKDTNGDPVPATGANGKDGVNGADGKDGVNGVNGADGKDGKDGKDGSVDLTITETPDAIIIVYKGVTYKIPLSQVLSVELPAEKAIEISTVLDLGAYLKINPDDASWSQIKWDSSREDVATIDEKGLVKGISLGITEITVLVTSRSGDTKSTKCNIIVYRHSAKYSRPHMALEYMAEYNLWESKTFSTVSNNFFSGYFAGNEAISVVPEGYHLPTQKEWAGIFPLTQDGYITDGNTYFYNKFIFTFTNSFSHHESKNELCIIQGKRYDFDGDYYNNGDGTTYAMRFKTRDNNMRSAFRYQFIGPFTPEERNSRLVITQVYIGNNEQKNVEDDKFWEDIDVMYQKGYKENIVIRRLQMTGYGIDNHKVAGIYQRGNWAEYLSDSGSFRLKIIPKDLDQSILLTNAKTVNIGTYLNAIRPFKDDL